MGRASPKVDEELTAYLAEQRHHIAAQFAPQMRQLYLGIWEKRMGVLLRRGHRGCRHRGSGGAGRYGVGRRPQQGP